MGTKVAQAAENAKGTKVSQFSEVAQAAEVATGTKATQVARISLHRSKTLNPNGDLVIETRVVVDFVVVELHVFLGL